jgi:Mg-chelatase subunit ChlD
VEQTLATLVAAGDFEAAADVVEKRLAGKLSKKWRGELEQRHIDLFVSAGEAAQTPEERAAHWKRAAAVAAEYGHDDRLPRALLAAVDARQMHQQAASRFALQRDRRWQDFITAVSRVMPPAARDAVLRTIETSVPKEYQPTGLSQAIVDNLLAWAEGTVPLSERAERLRAVIAECAKRKISPKVAQLQLAAVLQELERQAPVVLIAGTSVQLKAVRSENHPAIAYDVAIASAARLPLENLAGKDFVVHDAERRRVTCEIMPSIYATGSDQSVVVMLDHSPSTELVRNSANSGVTAMISAAPRGTQFRVLAFHEDVVAVTDWTDRLADIDSRLRTFKTTGSRTSIGRAMTVGVAELAQRPGSRLLVLFTDGKETTGEIVKSNELIAACRQKSIRVLTIGLENPDLDEALLAELAAGTGGKYYAASRQEQLVDQFRSLPLKQSTPVYRVALLASPAIQWPLELAIGRGPHAARVNLPQATPQR